MQTYTNPILDADWPDPDVIRVGSDYFLVASSFNRAPGLPILHSTDLVSWTILTHALPALVPADRFATPQHGCGVWAPSLRHHDGIFYLTYPDPDQGIFVLTATNAAGPWSEPHLLIPGVGLIDPCPFWDDDGRTYLVHAWAASRSGICNRLDLIEVSTDLRAVVGQPTTVVDGDAVDGCRTLEGPKMHRRADWYWIFAPGGGVATGWQYAFRSRSVRGPYERRIVLEQGDSPVNGPHQGAWVDTGTGEDWFVHFQDRGPIGRVVHLQPMTWQADGWPRMGTGGTRTAGFPVSSHPAPKVLGGTGRQHEPARSDNFAETILAPQWHWQANPDDDWARLDGDGVLRLSTATPDPGNLRELGAILGQQFPGEPHEVTTSVRLPSEDAPDARQTRAGLVVLGAKYAWIGLQRKGKSLQLVCRSGPGAEAEIDLIPPTELGPTTPAAPVQLRLRTTTEGLVTFAWRLDCDWQEVPLTFQAVQGRWIGAEIGLFACGTAITTASTENPKPAELGAVSVTPTSVGRL